MRGGGRLEAWRHLEDELRCDVALLQEANPGNRPYHGFSAIGGGRRWGSLVVVRDRLPALPLGTLKGSAMKTPVPSTALSQTYPGAVHACEITLENAKPLIAVSVYVVQENNVAQTVAHRILSDLFPLLTDARYRDRIILGGDLNVSTQLTGMWARHSRSALDRITQAYGLVNLTDGLRSPTQRLPGCPCRDEICSHIRTRRSSNSPVPWQTDYLFASPKLAASVARVDCPSDDDPAYAFSDHAPVIAELQI
jgi:exonuclease III